MPTISFSGIEVHVTDDGYFAEPEQWSEQMAPVLAAGEGIAELTEEHWAVLRFVRARYLAGGSPPRCRIVARYCGMSVQHLYELFPTRPIKLAAKIAGVPQPVAYIGGCGINWRSRWR